MANSAFVYNTIDTPGESMYRVLASKHIGLAIHVTSEVQIKSQLEEWWKLHHNATHICYAWRLGWDKKRNRINDDGEPSGTAGKPIYGQIVSFDLTNVLVAVIRYYGGTKLGTGGLIDAYKTAASEAIQQAKIIQREAHQIIDLTFPYEHMPAVMKVLKALDMEKLDAAMDVQCSMKIALSGSRLVEFEKWSADQEYLIFTRGDLF